MRLIKLAEIKESLKLIDVLPLIEQGFVAYSQGQAVVPPVAELVLDEHEGEVHIKYGFLKEDDVYVIKIASGFYKNAALGLPSSNGMMLVFKQQTGEPLALLQDNGFLTDVRTSIAGAIAAKYLAPKNLKTIGMVGTGVQARLQLRYLKTVTDCRDVLVWGRRESAVERYLNDMHLEGFKLRVAQTPQELMHACQLIVTTTTSKDYLLDVADLQAGTHITAVGSDTPEKQELDARILAKADLLVVDSIAQCKLRGEASQALRQGFIKETDMLELGSVIASEQAGRSSENQITVADLTGVAVQDIQIAKAVYLANA